MLSRGVRLALLLSPDKITSQLTSYIRYPARVYLDLSRTKYLREPAKLTNILNLIDEISGVHIKLTQLKMPGLIDLISRILTREMRLLITIDTACTTYVRNFIYNVSMAYNLTPVIDLEKPIDRLCILESTNIDTVLFRYPAKIRNTTLRFLPYLKDYLNSLFKTRRIIIGSLIEKVNFTVLNMLRDILSLSSLVVLTNPDLAAQICEALYRGKSVAESLQDLSIRGQVVLDLNIE